jgi:hypothetical protein
LRSPKDFDLYRVTDESGRPTPTPIPSLNLSGRVFGTSAEPGAQDPFPVVGASIFVSVCVPRPPFEAQTDDEGRYTLEIPGGPIASCDDLVFYVSQEGYEPHEETIPLAELWAQPERDFVLAPVVAPAGIYLPWLANKEGQ